MAKKGSVIVVDDEEIMRDVLETLLSAEGYRVDLAKTGEAGLEVYAGRPYDAVDVLRSGVAAGGPSARDLLVRAYLDSGNWQAAAEGLGPLVEQGDDVTHRDAGDHPVAAGDRHAVGRRPPVDRDIGPGHEQCGHRNPRVMLLRRRWLGPQ